MRSHARSTPWLTFFFALLGLMWCGYVAFPTANPAPCATSGCALFRDTRVAGLSLWWVGGAYFFLLSVLCLRGKRVFARFLAMLALFGDALLLVIMFLTAPCFDCLVVAALMACCYFSLRQQPATDGWFTEEASRSILLPVWLGLFLGNVVLAANEQMPLYTMGNTNATDVRVYFSPSCPACREAILSLGNSAALHPVEEAEGDIDSIIRLDAMLKGNVPLREALARCLNSAEPAPYLPFYERAILSVQLLRNKASLMRQGFRAVPLIQINGMPGYKTTPLDRPYMTRQTPASLLEQERSADPVYHIAPPTLPPDAGSALPGADGNAAPFDMGLPDFLHEPDNLQQCGGDTAAPCN